jgi:DME family drug/metabolite transporter
VVLGTACCVVSALGYTAANICLRKLAPEADKMWTICIKEVVTVSVVGPWLVYQAFRRRRMLPSPLILLVLVLTGLAVQLAGNLPMQWAFSAVGIAITVPAVFGVTLVCCAVFGLVFLGEKVSGRSVASIAVLIGSIVLLSLGNVMGEPSAPLETAVANASALDAPPPTSFVVFRFIGATSAEPGNDRMNAVTANDPDAATTGGMRAASPVLWGLLGVGACCLTGVMFAALSTVVRFSTTARVPVATIVFIVTGMGVLSLGSLSVRRLGVQALLHTDPNELAWMLAAGAFNLVAFLAITKGLQLTTVVHANVLNASQVAMGGLAGLMIFRESLNSWVVAGICLTIVGILFIGRPEEETPAIDGA